MAHFGPLIDPGFDRALQNIIRGGVKDFGDAEDPCSEIVREFKKYPVRLVTRKTMYYRPNQIALYSRQPVGDLNI